MNELEVKKQIEVALNLLYRTEKNLLDRQPHECAISARILLHLQHLMPEWDVDIEFNRQNHRDPKQDQENMNRRPDIIIHKRGPSGPNLALLQVKAYWNNDSRDEDIRIANSLQQRQGYNFIFQIELLENSFQIDTQNESLT